MESTGRKGLIRLLKYLNEEEIIKKKGGEKGRERLNRVEGAEEEGGWLQWRGAQTEVTARDSFSLMPWIKKGKREEKKVYFEFYSDLLRLMPIIRVDHLRFCRTNCAK